MHQHRLNRAGFVASSAALAAGFSLTGTALGATPIDITVTHYPALDYSLPVVIAQQLGYLGREGIDLHSITGSEGGGTTVRNIAQGGLIMGQVATTAAIQAILAGEDLKIFAGAVQTCGTNCWVVRKDSPIASIRDFVGKTVGYTSPGSASEAMLKLALIANNVDVSKVNTKAAGGVGENLTLLKTGGLDVAFTVDPVYTLHKDDFRLVFFARQYVPSFLQTVWICGSQTLQNQGPLLAGFIRAWTAAVNYVWAHPIDAAARYAHATNQDPNLFAITLADEHVRAYFGQGQLTAKGFEVVAQSMRIGKLLAPDQRIDVAKMVDQSALPPAMRTNLNVMV